EEHQFINFLDNQGKELKKLLKKQEIVVYYINKQEVKQKKIEKKELLAALKCGMMDYGIKKVLEQIDIHRRLLKVTFKQLRFKYGYGQVEI
ncbi:1388_t:CDS:1, partial [Gigaspora rosea]